MSDSAVEEEVRAALATMVEAMNKGDRDGVASTLSTRADVTMIGTDPEEWWTGQQLLASLGEAMTAGASPVQAVVDDTFVHVMGDVAWLEGRGRFVDTARRERAVRFTGVVIREDGEWKGVQSHASIGVPNDQLFA